MNTETELFLLLDYLEDELRGLPDVRVRLKPRAVPMRAPDLEQDYDAEANTIHSSRGINVRAGGRDYFFPVEWVQGSNRVQIDDLVREIREFIETR